MLLLMGGQLRPHILCVRPKPAMHATICPQATRHKQQAVSQPMRRTSRLIIAALILSASSSLHGGRRDGKPSLSSWHLPVGATLSCAHACRCRRWVQGAPLAANARQQCLVWRRVVARNPLGRVIVLRCHGSRQRARLVIRHQHLTTGAASGDPPLTA